MTSLHDLHPQPRRRPTTCSKGVTTAHFGELRDPLIDFINGSEVIVGCVAWVTERTILSALAARPVALVVQKENLWKKTDARGKSLAQRYVALNGGLPAQAFPAPLSSSKAILAPISCLGHGSASQTNPLMHHKFIVRCSMREGLLVPAAVWTGSFNFSANANCSLENAVEIHDPIIAAAYLAEFSLAASMSEGMNWRFTKPSSNLGRVFVAPIAVPNTMTPAKTTTAKTVTPSTRRKRPTRRRPASRPSTTKVRKVAAKAPSKAKSSRPATKKTTVKKSTTPRAKARKVAAKTPNRASNVSPLVKRKTAPTRTAAKKQAPLKKAG